MKAISALLPVLLSGCNEVPWELVQYSVTAGSGGTMTAPDACEEVVGSIHEEAPASWLVAEDSCPIDFDQDVMVALSTSGCRDYTQILVQRVTSRENTLVVRTLISEPPDSWTTSPEGVNPSTLIAVPRGDWDAVETVGRHRTQFDGLHLEPQPCAQ